MHILNELFSKVFVITVNPPNERASYISDYFSTLNLNYDLRVSTNKSFFHTQYDGNTEINTSEQSLASTYSSILYECFYKQIERIVIIEDDNIFVDRFEEKFGIFYKNLPDTWDVLHLGNDRDLKDQTNDWIKLEHINQYVGKVKLKFTTNCTMFNKWTNYKIIADKIVDSKYPIDIILIDFFQRDSLIAYSPTTPLTNQLSSRESLQSPNTSEKRFNSLIRNI